MSRQPILLVEDNPEDYFIARRAFEETNIINPLFHCETGEEALAFLKNEPPFEDSNQYPKPGIILLDLNLPGIDGREVLKYIKSEERLCAIPVIVLTTSNDEIDVKECYKDGANSYLKKPVNVNDFLNVVKTLNEYWFVLSILPKSAG